MKVDGNAPTFDYATRSNGQAHFSNIPIRLEIASNLMAGICASNIKTEAEKVIPLVFKIADRLIAEHNKTYEGKDGS